MLTIASMLLLCPSSAHAQGGVPLWTNRFNGPGNGNDDSRAIAVDSSGNVFVTGEVGGDYATIKYSNSGLPLWTNLYGRLADSEDRPLAMALDINDNVFVTGVSWPGPDYSTVAYSNSGVPLWTNLLLNPGSSVPAISADSSGNVFVSGSSGTVKYSGTGEPLWTNSLSDSLIALDASGNLFLAGGRTIKFSNGGTPLWTNLWGGGLGHVANAIAVDNSGNVFVTGDTAPLSGDCCDYKTVAYSGAGVLLWTRRYSGPGNSSDNAYGIAVDRSGNVFVTGESIAANGFFDYATIKYSGAGVPLWTNRYNGPGNRDDKATGIAVDGSGNVFVTGYSSNGTNDDYATVAYSSSGILLWTNRFNGPGNGNDSAKAIAVDRTGNVFVMGDSWNGSNTDFVTIKYSSSVPLPRLAFQKLNNELVLSWTNAGFTLQSAPFVTGPFTNLPVATSPYTNPLTAQQQFFRLSN